MRAKKKEEEKEQREEKKNAPVGRKLTPDVCVTQLPPPEIEKSAKVWRKGKICIVQVICARVLQVLVGLV